MKRRLANFILSSQVTVIIAAEIIGGVLINLLLLLFFLDLITDLQSRTLINYDVVISQLIYTLRTPWLTTLMIWVSALGADVMVGLGSLLCIVATLKHHRKEAALFAITLIMGVLLNTALKSVAARPRPGISPLIIESSYSFPSGHAMNSFIFYTLCAYFSYHFWHNRRLTLWLTFGAGLLVAMIGFSRVYLGVHYPSDVLAGYVAGGWWFLTVLLTERTFLMLRWFRHSE